jgi:rubrerythrin
MVESTAELYVHAIAMEREAAERYAEFSRRMADEGNTDVAALFARLAAQESEHLATLRRRTSGVELPPLESDYSWIDTGAPETLAHDLVFRLMTPHQALGVALRAEKNAKAFFEQAQRVAGDPGLRALAREMAAEEKEHIAMLEALLARTPEAVVDWAALYDAR